MKKLLHVETILKSLEFVAKKSYFTWEISYFFVKLEGANRKNGSKKGKNRVKKAQKWS